MTYKIKYLPLAVQDLNEIARYLSGFYPKTASRVLKELRDKIAKLGDNPKMCEIYPLDPVYRQMVPAVKSSDEFAKEKTLPVKKTRRVTIINVISCEFSILD